MQGCDVFPEVPRFSIVFLCEDHGFYILEPAQVLWDVDVILKPRLGGITVALLKQLNAKNRLKKDSPYFTAWNFRMDGRSRYPDHTLPRGSRLV